MREELNLMDSYIMNSLKLLRYNYLCATITVLNWKPAFMKINLFKLPRHRVFHHVPIYYDEAKEKQAERLQNAKEELGLLTEEEKMAAVGSRIRGGMRRKRADFFEQAYSERKKSNRTTARRSARHPA